MDLTSFFDFTSAPDLSGFPTQIQLHLLTLYIVAKAIGALYSSIRNGGGLKRIMTSFWLGENLPKPVNQDYKAELSKPTIPTDSLSQP